MLMQGVAPQQGSSQNVVVGPTSNLITPHHRPPHTSPNNLAIARSQIPSSIVMLHSLRHTRPLSSFPSFPKLLAAMSHCSAVTTASNSAAVAAVDSEGGHAARGPTSKPRLRGVVFDMDGTLTVPAIDFQAMYKAVLGEATYAEVRSKSPSGIDILNLIEGWSADRQQKAYEIIARFEKEGIDRLQIMPGASELCRFLDSKRIRRGLITRNVKDAVDVFHKHFGSTFSPALSREFRPFKPNPAPLLHICSVWEFEPNEVLMIGDSLKDDVACGKRAGAYTCLLDETGRYDSPEYSSVEHKPDFKVSSLNQVLTHLESHFHLNP